MQIPQLDNSIAVKVVSEEPAKGVFEIEGLYAGYGLTLGNALRRVLLSSLPGAAITEIKVKNAPHEFSTLPGVKEDLVELILNFKKVRLVVHNDEPHVLSLKAKGEGAVTAGDIKADAEVEIVNPDLELAHLTAKDAEFDVELRVERGLGYSPTESRKGEGRLPIGTVAVDAIFTPVLRVQSTVENMRVGDRTDYNRLRLEITTDGTVSPSSALSQSVKILKDHFEKVSLGVAVQEFAEAKPEKKKAKSKKKE